MRKQAEVGKVYRTALVPEMRSIDEEKRTIEFVASTEAVDRYGDVIKTSGWRFENYLKNPVFLFGHKSSEPPIGRTVEIKIETSPVPALVQRVKFADAATYKFADTVFNLYKGGYMRAVSVGFMPLETPERMTDLEGNATGGYLFTSQELLELSAVSLPANHEALARCVQKGFAEADLARVFAPALTPEAVYRDLAEINHEIALVAVGLARATLLKADEVCALLKAARVQAESGGELTLAEMLAVIRGSGAAAKEAESLESESGDGEITTLDQLAAAVGSDDEPSSIEEVFSDSRSLRTGKFQFALRSELR